VALTGRRDLLRAGGAGALATLLAPVVAACETRPVSSAPRSPDATRISYGPDSSQFGELSVPPGTPKGVVVVIHGGFWKAAYGLSLGRPLAESLVQQGWAAWNIEYRRVGDGGGDPETLDDVAAAIDTLHGTGLDLSRVVALGHSAGGHLATWAASRGRFPRWTTKVDLTGVVAQAGVLDLVAAYDEGLGGGAVQAFLGNPPGPADAAADPIRQVPLEVPVHCVHGVGDEIVPIAQSRTYVAAAREAGATADLTEVQGDHFAVIDPTTEIWTQTLAMLDGG
jgi:acetyl esterase/lipase